MTPPTPPNSGEPPLTVDARLAPATGTVALRGLDAAALFMSGLCLVHCLALPLLLALLPLAASSFVAGESFHRWMLVGVVPTSVMALGWGWRQHREVLVAVLGLGGMGLIAWAALAGVSHDAERNGTVAGALMLAGGHLRNYRLRHRGHLHLGPHDH